MKHTRNRNFLKCILFSIISLTSITSCGLLGFNSNSNSTSSSTSSSNSGSTSSSTSNSTSSSTTTDEDKNYGDKLIPYKVNDSYFTIPNSNIKINKDGEYVKKEEVAAYVMYYKKMPKNFFIQKDRNVCVKKYPKTCMLYGTEKHGNREGLLPKQFSYKELDVYKGDISYSEAKDRGAYRFVFTYNNRDVKDDSLYFTTNHYNSYVAYKNYYGGWTENPWNDIKDMPNLTSGEYVKNSNGNDITYIK